MLWVIWFLMLWSTAVLVCVVTSATTVEAQLQRPENGEVAGPWVVAGTNLAFSDTLTLSADGKLQAVVDIVLLNPERDVQSTVNSAYTQFAEPADLTAIALGRVPDGDTMGTYTTTLSPNQTFKTNMQEAETDLDQAIGNAMLPPNLTATNVSVSGATTLGSTQSLDDLDLNAQAVTQVNQLSATAVTVSGSTTLPTTQVTGTNTWALGANQITNLNSINALSGAGHITATTGDVDNVTIVTVNPGSPGSVTAADIDNVSVLNTSGLALTPGLGAGRIISDPAGNGTCAWVEPTSLNTLTPTNTPNAGALPVFASSSTLTGLTAWLWQNGTLRNASGSIQWAANISTPSLVGPVTVTGDAALVSHRLITDNLTLTAGSGTTGDVFTNTGGGGIGTWDTLTGHAATDGTGTATRLVRWASASQFEDAGTWTSVGNTWANSAGVVSGASATTSGDWNVAGQLNSTAGDITAANVDSTNGSLSGNTLTATGLISGTNVTGAQISGVQVNSSSGHILATTTVTATTGDLTASVNVQAAGDVNAGAALTATSTVTGETGLTATTGDITATTGALVAGATAQAQTLELDSATATNAILVCVDASTGAAEWNTTGLQFNLPTNVLPKASGTGLVASNVFDTGSIIQIQSPAAMAATADLTVFDSQVLNLGTLALEYDGSDALIECWVGDFVWQLVAGTVQKLGSTTDATAWQVVQTDDTLLFAVRGDGTLYNNTTTAGVLTATEAGGWSTWSTLNHAQVFGTFVVASPQEACHRETGVTSYTTSLTPAQSLMHIAVDTTFAASLTLTQDTYVWVSEGATLTVNCAIPANITLTVAGPGSVNSTVNTLDASATGARLVLQDGLTLVLSGATFTLQGDIHMTLVNISNTAAADLLVGGSAAGTHQWVFQEGTCADATLVQVDQAVVVWRNVQGSGLLDVEGVSTAATNYIHITRCTLGKMAATTSRWAECRVSNTTFASTWASVAAQTDTELWSFTNCVFTNNVTITDGRHRLRFTRCEFNGNLSITAATGQATVLLTHSTVTGTCTLNVRTTTLTGTQFANTVTVSPAVTNHLVSARRNTCEAAWTYSPSVATGNLLDVSNSYLTTHACTAAVALNALAWANNLFTGVVTWTLATVNVGGVAQANVWETDCDVVGLNTGSIMWAGNRLQALSKTGTSTTSFVSANQAASISGFTAAEAPAGYNRV